MTQEDSALKLIVRGGKTLIDNPEKMLRRYMTRPIDMFYLEYKSITDPDKLFPEDVAITLAFNSQARGRAVYSLHEHSFDLSAISDTPLEITTDQERSTLAELVAEMAKWKGIKTSIATKILHKKRPNLIPVLDNKAIFGAYMNPQWPERKEVNPPSVEKKELIKQALVCIYDDLNASANKSQWPKLKGIAPQLTTIQIFDMIWWEYFTEKENRI